MSAITHFTQLRIYQYSLELAVELYILTAKFPKTETYGIIDQIRRAVASIGANIAEGFGRFTTKEKRLYLIMARGHCMKFSIFYF